VDNFTSRIPDGEMTHVPTGGHEPIASAARGAADNFSVHHQVQTSMALVIAAADPKRNVLPSDLEFWRGERACRLVALDLAARHLIIARVSDLQFGKQAIGYRPLRQGVSPCSP